ncbi:MAG: phytanoyl-CoA dioxygenase family protein [Rhodospirillales bacterium]|nr:phytanoyl-CoA dioxygenase family protein [Rhodospirillales bacterium]
MKRAQSGPADPFSDTQKRRFVEQGFVHVASAVPAKLVRRARRAINHSLGAGIDQRDVARMNSRSFCEELVEDPRLLRLATNPGAWSHVRSLVGVRRVERPRECQIALRFPRPEGTPRTLDAPHLDGYHTPYNGLPDDGVVYGFTLLLGVMLSDVDEPLSGNFTVWPGTHRKLERYFRDHGVSSLKQGDVTTSGIRLPRPVPITGRAGDVVLAHYQLAHAASPNLSGDIRYMCFFRLSVRGLANHRVESMVDIWRDWPALAEFVGRSSD